MKPDVGVVSDTSTKGRLPTGMTYALVLPLSVLLIGGLIWPLSSILSKSFYNPDLTLTNYVRIFKEPLYVNVILSTLQISLAVTVMTLIAAYPFAYVMWRSTTSITRIMMVCLVLSLWTSVLVRSYAWIVLLQRSGIVNEWLISAGIIDRPLKLLYTNFSIIIAMTHILLPFMILPIYTSLRATPVDLARAARSLGAGAVSAFIYVTLPLSLPGVYAGTILVFILAIGFYVTPALVGGPENLTIATLIAENVTVTLNWGFAAALSGVLLIVTMAIVFIFRRALNVGGRL